MAEPGSLQVDISALIKSAQEQLIETTPHTIDHADKADLAANKLPASLKAQPINIYALWKRAGASGKWELMYIGERKKNAGWYRIGQHLFFTPKGTQSKLGQVRAAIESGAQMGVTAILVEPDSMRLAIEEELISRNSTTAGQLPWNQKGRAKWL